MAVVGFQVIESSVNESVGNKFTCIEIMSGGPLLLDSEILFYTQDGTATGEKISLKYCAKTLTQFISGISQP